ncbi:hypothetical protein DEU56DRAFT_939794 [Suillus clintonianus]|uniref:uncharacterized protein n=1 Tax=Suillus clintonianus TaxID=1904413 RepID=UPI001B871164|nr:uncharacterized protein DEU56DRAFT_939794 [Suillus clintonianus]KAG2142392.1 hypothetical protein DEU56DRAFT_939794 [Suillus clintonianus]
MSGTLESQCIRLEVISAKNLEISSNRIPASISSHTSPALTIEIRVSYELDRMLGNGEVIGKLETSWDELLDHGDETFELSLPPVRGAHPSLTVKAVVVHACENQDITLFDSLVDCEVARGTDAGHARFAEYMSSGTASYLDDAVEHFQLVLERCPVGHPDHAAALTNLAWARLEGYIRQGPQDIDNITSLFREALALRPHGHPDFALSLHRLIQASNRRYKEGAHCQGTYLRSIGLGSEVDYVILQCNTLPIEASNEGIHHRRNVLEHCPAITLYEEALRLRPVGHENVIFHWATSREDSHITHFD